MHAAVVTAFDSPPAYREFPRPTTQDPDEVVADVLAVGLHPRVRSQANGSHYTSSGDLPLVPGVDGVARTPDGQLRYFVLEDTTMGAMAEQTIIDLRRSVVLPAGADPVAIAAAMNPAMSSWCWARPATPGGWRSRWPSTSAPATSSGPAGSRASWPPWPGSGPT